MKKSLPLILRITAILFSVIFLGTIPPEALAQTRSVSGVVKSNDQDALPGVSIVEKGTSNGTVTDSDGKYTLNVSSGNATLMISFIGMAPQEVQVGDRTTIDVELQADITQLDEVVVVGYGTQKKSDLTGSIVSITGEDLRKMPVSTVAETLTGRLAGVNVSSTEGSPDAEIRIRVRGGTSITQNNSPLFIVDGFPVKDIRDISPSDIKSIDVLKDASSTAIYGSRGANGVVIITTKSGSTDGKVSVSYNAFAGFKTIAKTLDVLSPQDFVKWQYEYAMLDDSDDLSKYEDYFGTYSDMDLYAGVKGNNWQKQVYGRTGKVFSNDLSIRGGTDKFNYSVNYARFQEKTIMIGSDYNRDNLTLKLNNKPNDKVDLNFSLRYSRTEINGSGANEQNEVSSADSRLKHAVAYSPIPVDGIANDDPSEAVVGDFLTNPFMATADNDRQQERKNFNMGGGFAWKIIDNLQFKIEGGLDTYSELDNRFYGLSTYFVRNRPLTTQNQPAVVLSDRKEVRFRNTNTLSYDFKKLLSANHHLNVLLGQEALKTEVNVVTTEVRGFPKLFTSDQAFKLTSQGKEPLPADNFYFPDDKLLSFFGRLNYDYNDKYFFQGVYRADGSSKFMKNNRWGYFPSASVGWKISKEEFMNGLSGKISMLKLRASYGVAGNNNIPVGQTVQSFISSNNSWINGVSNYWAAAKTMANPDLVWETTITRNIGLDLGLWQDRLTGSIEFYRNNTDDQLIRFPIPGSGYDDQFRNLGEMKNEGIDLSLSYAAIEKENYGLNFSFNISFNRSEVMSIGSMEYIPGTSNWASTAIGPDYQVMVGMPFGLMYGYRNDGRYEVSDFEGYDESTERWILKAGVADASLIVGSGANTIAPGMMKLRDITGEGTIGADDREIIGRVQPKNTGGFIINGYAYGLDLTASFNWSYGNDVYNANKIEFTTATPQSKYRNLTDIMADGNRWTNIDQATGKLVTDPSTLEAMNANTTMWSPYMSRYIFSDWAVEDGSFLRLNTLTLGYTLPSNLSTKLKLKNLRVYATGYNVLLLTNYSGFDPEVSTRRNTPYTPGVDYSAYPRSRQLVFGLNFNF